MANVFQSVLNDPDGSRLLCVDTGQPVAQTNPDVSIAVWGDFVDRCSSHYHFGDKALEKALADKRKRLASEIGLARQNGNRAVDTASLELQRDELEREILALREQAKQAESLLESHVDELKDWLAANRLELVEHFSTADRARQFLRDGSAGPEIAQDVESIRKQVKELREKRRKKVREWSGEVNAIWDSLELSINGLAVSTQRDKPHVFIHRPHDQSGAAIKWINTIVPWFDLIVGVMLLVGLFPRVAALAGALFLASVIATQPPWIPGATPVWPQAIEMLALFVLSSNMAAAIPGLGWLFSKAKTQPNPSGSLAVPVSTGS
jgi:uncharacterized membrane protein YphA (DoxX/SURF4 family)